MRVALVVDNKLRDLPGIVLTGYKLCQMGITVMVVPSHLKYHEALALYPDLLVNNFLRSVATNERFYREVGQANIKHVILDTEGGVFPHPEKMWETLTKDDDLRRKVATYCFWGPELANHARERKWFTDDQITVTGCPRMDFYHKDWRGAALEFGRALYWGKGEDPNDNRPIVMVNGNFSFGNPKFVSAEQQLSMEMRYFGVDEATFRKQQEVQLEALRKLCEITNIMAEKFPSVRFVYRPHPFEGHEIYHELLNERDNILLSGEGTVDGWISRSSAVIQRGCTTGIEAGMAGVPALQPEWVPPWEPKPVVDKCSVSSYSMDELEAQLRSILGGHFVIPSAAQAQIDAVTASVFHAMDGKAYARVAEVCRRRLSKKKVEDPAYQREKRRLCKEAYYRTFQTKAQLPGKRHRLIYELNKRLTHLLDAKPITDQKWKARLEDWDGGPRLYSLEEVEVITRAVERAAKAQGIAKCEVNVTTAEADKEYGFGFKTGRTIMMRPGKTLKNSQ